MSWQAYVDTSLVGTGKLKRAAIFNKEGTSVWASSPDFTVTPAEIKEIVTAYNDNQNVLSNGLYVGGERYVVLKVDDRSLYAKKGKEGICIVKTTLAILVSHYPETVQPGEATKTVEELADYLISVGY
ncbi:MAG: profilin, required for normal timing of actin polymerization in response to thermal stress [Trichoglossum hirsutum]|nr:MAG: profilin, required for normal timing of actin polymerization in response to thermal stress [Trichoglossum hirsutum]